MIWFRFEGRKLKKNEEIEKKMKILGKRIVENVNFIL